MKKLFTLFAFMCLMVSGAWAEIDVPKTGYYYIKENSKYLYNDLLTSDHTLNADTKKAYYNGYVWYITSTEGSTTITLLNGEGAGYKADATSDETKSIDLNSKEWTFEPYGAGDHIVPVQILYAIDGDYTPFKSPDAYMTYSYSDATNTNKGTARHGGFLTVKSGTRIIGRDDMNYSSKCINQTSPDGTKWIDARTYNPADWNEDVRIYYYTEQDAERYLDIVNKCYSVFYENVGNPGCCKAINADFEDPEAVLTTVRGILEYADFMGRDFAISALKDYIEPYEAKYILGQLNKYIKTLDIAQPTLGDAYLVAVRGNDYTWNTKYYLKNDGTYTTDKSKADVFVLGGSGDNTYNLFFVTNNNPDTEGGPHYLQNSIGASGLALNTNYKADDNALKLDPMTLAEGADIESCPAYLYGTFSVKSSDGNVMTFDESSKTWNTSADHLYMKENMTSAIELIPIEYPYNKVKMTEGNDRVKYSGSFASIYLPYPMTMPAGVEVYEGTAYKECEIKESDNPNLDPSLVGETINFLRLNCIKEAGEAANIPAGAYILYSQNADEADFTALPAPEAVAATGNTNVLDGSTENPEKTTGDAEVWTTFKAGHTGTPYVLGNKNGIGLYVYTGTTMPKGKAIYFSGEVEEEGAPSAPKGIKLDFGGIITAIEALHGNTAGAEIYDLQGRRLDKVQKGQINVINGKKIMFN